MTRFFNPGGHEGAADGRLHAPATARNREPILDVLKAHLPSQGSLLEIASGTGEHAAHMAPHFPTLHWQPTDIDDRHLASIEAWRAHMGHPGILPARHLDVLAADWGLATLPSPLVAVMAANLVHISPLAVTEALVMGAGRALGPKGVLYLYGPYKREGRHTAPSNEAFDAMLRASNPEWGVRDMEWVCDLAEQAGFRKPETAAMPSNNFSLIFKK